MLSLLNFQKNIRFPMDIDRCNSVFELFSAFNFTYAILSHPNPGIEKVNDSRTEANGKSFADVVDSYLIKPFNNLSDIIVPLELKIIKLTESVETAKLSSNDRNKIDLCNDLLQKISATNLLIDIWKDIVEKSKDAAKFQINQRFPYASFLLALFCISVLILAASTSSHKHLTLLMLDVLLTIEVIWYFILPERKNNQLTYRNLLYTYCIGLIIVTCIHFFIKFYIQTYMPSVYNCGINLLDKNELVRPFFILLNIIIPFSHFIYYYISFQKKLRIKNDEAKQQIPLIQESIHKIEIGHGNLGSIEV